MVWSLAAAPTLHGQSAGSNDTDSGRAFFFPALPGNVVGSPAFARITNTRFATGESGSSHQIQLAVRMMF